VPDGEPERTLASAVEQTVSRTLDAPKPTRRVDLQTAYAPSHVLARQHGLLGHRSPSRDRRE
jgi:hypothetical protein